MIHNVRSLRARTVPSPPITPSLFPKAPKLTPSPTPRQNNSRLDELSSKISALRGVTIDIYDNARNQDVLDSSVCTFLLSLLRNPPSPYAFPNVGTRHLSTTTSRQRLQSYHPPASEKNQADRDMNVERSLLLHDDIHKRQRGPPRPDGAKRE